MMFLDCPAYLDQEGTLRCGQLPHDTILSRWQVLRAYLRRIDIMYRTVPDRDSWPGEAERIGRAAWALRTPAQRRQVLGDLAAQPRLLTGLGFDPGRGSPTRCLPRSPAKSTSTKPATAGPWRGKRRGCDLSVGLPASDRGRQPLTAVTDAGRARDRTAASSAGC
jgi:hypothetical protein